MFAFVEYMLKSAMALILFYIGYKAFLSRETFFRMNRFMLLGGMLVCLLLPLIPVRISDDVLAVREQYLPWEELRKQERIIEMQIVYPEILPDEIALEKEERLTSSNVEYVEETSPLSWFTLAIRIYVIGGVSVLIWLLYSFRHLIKLVHDGKHKQLGKYTLVLVDGQTCPFSWGKWIVMNENDFRDYPEQILLHEQMHVDRKHTLDLLAVEVLLVFQWFNPVVWLLKEELQELHEYEADKGVLAQGIDATKYQLLLVKKAVGARLYSIANSFNHSKLKNRITMMLKEKSNCWARLKVLLLTPLMALLMLAFARPEKTNPGPEVHKVIQIPDNPETDFLKEKKVSANLPIMSLEMKVKTKLKDSIKELTVSYSINSGKSVDELVNGIQKGYGMYNNILSAVIGRSLDCPEQQATEYTQRIALALKTRGVKDISYKAYGNAVSKQKTENTPWTEEFFIQELKRNGGGQYGLQAKDLTDHFGDGYLMILINSKGLVAFADKLVPQNQIKDKIVRFLTKHLDGTSYFITLQKDIQTPTEVYQGVLNAIGEAYQEVRSKASTQGMVPEKLDDICPIRLGVIPDKDTWKAEK